MRYQNLKSFQKHLSSAAPNNLCRVYLIAVADDFERASALDAILACLSTPDTLPSRFSGADFSLRDILDAIQSPSLLGGDPIVILDEMEKAPKKEMETLLRSPIAGGYLLLGSRAKTPHAAAIEKQGVVLDLTDEKPWDKEKRLGEQLLERAQNAGKRLAPDALQLLFERMEKDAAVLESEIDKLICYAGDRSTIERSDVLAISAPSRSHTLWQTADDVIWDGKEFPPLDSSSFHALVPLLRAQLVIGLKLSALIEGKIPADEWNAHLPKMWPKALEKKASAAARLGAPFFKKALERLFEIELLSRSQSSQTSALLDLFRSCLHVR